MSNTIKMNFLIFVVLSIVLHFSCGQYHSSSATAGVNFESLSPAHASSDAAAQVQSISKPRQRRMYAMCPPNFQRIGQECFTYPQQHSSWLEAHFFCKDKNARLAEPEKYSDRKLREFLLKYDTESGDKDPIWIGATYDYINNVWQWSISGRNLTYNAFSKKYFEHNSNMENQCAVYDPQLRYRWSSRTCVDKHRFICQHKMPKVSENNRHKVYHRWNATYPNQYANEVILKVIDHRGKGRYNRRVIAEGSNEEMVVSSGPRNRQHTRRRPRPTSVSLPQENDVNYIPARHPMFPITTFPASSSPNNNDNEISAPQEATTTLPINAEKNARRRTMQDRKLQRQREKELRRLQRKKERQENMRREKEERLQKMRLEREQQKRKIKDEKQRQRAQQQTELEELRQRESDQAVDRQQKERQQEIEDLRRQKESEDKKHLEDQEEEQRREAYLQTLKEQEKQERLRKEEINRLDREREREEEQRLKEERKALEERKRKEYEQKLKAAENERARQVAEEHERKRLQDEEIRRRLEEEEKLKQAELKKQLEEEEERLRLKRLEEERIAEEEELARLREEQRKRAEIQRKREEEIARLEAEQRRIEQEEARIKDELEETERQAKLLHEAEIRKIEEEARAKEQERKHAEEQEERERQEKLRQAKLIEESRKLENKENITSSLKNRLASLSPELRKEFLEKRKQRKREKLLREKMLRQQQAESTNNEA